MKLNKISIMMLSAVAVLASCSDIDKQDPASGYSTLKQVQETNTAIASRPLATFYGMFTMMGKPYATYGSDGGRADDFGYISAAFSQDIEGADCVVQNSGYNWFSAPAAYTSRTASYANPYMRYKLPYNQVGVCNEIISDEVSYSANQRAQARAMRAFAYMSLAPYFAFGYSVDPSAPDIPLLKDGVDYTNNPRATVKEVYEYIHSELTTAIADLEANPTERGSDKSQITVNVAYGLRARCNLAMDNFAEAAADAEKAISGYTPASREDVSKPSFCVMSEPNWMWAINITESQVQEDGYPTSASWIGSFSGNSYSAACQCYACINKMLYAMIPETDIRKQWWVNENLQSTLLDGLTWTTATSGSASGQDIATFAYDDKTEFLPYTNVKFGMKNGIGSTVNNNDWPLMRVEEMYLIEAEALAKAGTTNSQGQTGADVLTYFVTNFRDPSYNINGRGLSLENEIWFQRRVELWGEGFFASDAKRLNKPIVRFHDGEESNWPTAWTFNIAENDGWLNMRFVQREIDNNSAIVDNTGGSLPVKGQNGSLRDGVTDNY